MLELRPYQHDAVQFLGAQGRGLLSFPPGAGKTAVVSSWLDAGNKNLIVAPNGPVLRHWQAEARRWGGLNVVIGTGKPQVRADCRHNVGHGFGAGLIINYELMRQDVKELLEIKWDSIVFDESHRLKDRTTQTYKAAALLARRAPELCLVTGTPILNHAKDLWTSLAMLDPDHYRSFWRWAEHYFEIDTVRRGRNLVREVGKPYPGALNELAATLRPLMKFASLKEILPDLPPTVETEYEVELSPAERRMYEDMKSKFWMEHAGNITAAINDAAKNVRLRQLSSDWTAFEDIEVPGAKVKAAVALIEELEDEQVVVFCAFRKTTEAVCAALAPGTALPFHGGLSVDQRNGTLRSFMDGTTKVIAGTIRTMAESIDGMQVARNVIMLDRDWTPARNEQAIGRVGGARAQRQVNVMHLVAQDTVDQRVANALATKSSVIDAVVGA